MNISNLNIRNLIRLAVLVLVIIGITDLVIAQTSGLLGEFFSGYSALIIPLLIIGTYAYIGMPIFEFNAESEILYIKSHSALTKVFGKELYVAKKNIVKFQIVRNRIRKKLKVTYIKNGREYSETFSIALLSNKKIEKLAKQVEVIHSELSSFSSPHLFI